MLQMNEWYKRKNPLVVEGSVLTSSTAEFPVETASKFINKICFYHNSIFSSVGVDQIHTASQITHTTPQPHAQCI